MLLPSCNGLQGLYSNDRGSVCWSCCCTAQAIAAAAAAGVFMTAIGSALQGQAHDGIDSVPETGTWLLQKGERVTTAKTSAKLDATLDRVANQSTGGGDLFAHNQYPHQW
jgi:hypothetical protein